MTKKPKRVMTKASKAGCRSAGGLRLVKDFSDGGVRLQLNGFEIPDDFTLLWRQPASDEAKCRRTRTQHQQRAPFHTCGERARRRCRRAFASSTATRICRGSGSP
jgi:hypothetical protein